MCRNTHTLYLFTCYLQMAVYDLFQPAWVHCPAVERPPPMHHPNTIQKPLLHYNKPSTMIVCSYSLCVLSQPQQSKDVFHPATQASQESYSRNDTPNMIPDIKIAQHSVRTSKHSGTCTVTNLKRVKCCATPKTALIWQKEDQYSSPHCL